MGLKELCERLGAEYDVRHNEKHDIISVKIYNKKERLWAYRESISDTLSGLFKEVYGDAIKELVDKPNSPFFLDKTPKE